MTEQTIEETIEQVMGLAAESDREALFAAVQAALGVITDMRFGRHDTDPYRRILRALEIGGPVGSPRWLTAAHATQGDP